MTQPILQLTDVRKSFRGRGWRAGDPAPAGERYYLLVFGAQTTPMVPRFTHTWVTFVRVPAP